MHNYPYQPLPGSNMPPMPPVPSHALVGRNGGNPNGPPVFHAPATGPGMNPNNMQMQPHSDTMGQATPNMIIQTYPNLRVPCQADMGGQPYPNIHIGISSAFIPCPQPPNMMAPQSNNIPGVPPNGMMITNPPGWSMVPVFTSANFVAPTGGGTGMALVPQYGNEFRGQRVPQNQSPMFVGGSGPVNFVGTGPRFPTPISQQGNAFHGQATPNQVPQGLQSDDQSTFQNQGFQNIPHAPVCATVILTTFPHVISMNSTGSMEVVRCEGYEWRFGSQSGYGDGNSTPMQYGPPQPYVADNNPGVRDGNPPAIQNYGPPQPHVADNNPGNFAAMQNYGPPQPHVANNNNLSVGDYNELPNSNRTFSRGKGGRLHK